MSEEIWKDVVGYEGLYQVSNIGRVRSKGRRGTQTKKEWEKLFTRPPSKLA